jgi:hypothetical protein
VVTAIRLMHGALTAFFVACIAYVYRAAVRRRVDRLAYVAVAAIAVEGIAITAGRGDCPLGHLHRRYGDEKAFFELILPERAAKLAVPVLGVIASLGIVLLFLPKIRLAPRRPVGSVAGGTRSSCRLLSHVAP